VGLSPEQFIGKTVYDISPVDLAGKYDKADRKLLNNPGVRTYGASVVYADGTRHDVVFNKAAFASAEGKVAGLIGVILDITERKQAEQALAHLNDELVGEAAALAEANAAITRLAATDDLTGLANRRCFYETLEKAVSLARRHGSPLAVVSLDLDGLKRVNDSAGHRAGDEALTSFAALLAALCRPVPHRGPARPPRRRRVQRAAAGHRPRWRARPRRARAGGGALLPGARGARRHGQRRGAQWTPGALPDDLLRRADKALYAAKRGGGDAVAGDG